MSDGMHLAQEQGERANAELHAELEQLVYSALQKIYDDEQGGPLNKAEWEALCYAAGFNHKQFEGKGQS